MTKIRERQQFSCHFKSQINHLKLKTYHQRQSIPLKNILKLWKLSTKITISQLWFYSRKYFWYIKSQYFWNCWKKGRSREKIGHVVVFLGWCNVVAVVCWLSILKQLLLLFTSYRWACSDCIYFHSHYHHARHVFFFRNLHELEECWENVCIDGRWESSRHWAI